VSEAVARAMASGAIAHSQADIVVAITGVAGPGGGTPRKPVGLVCFAFALRSGAVEAVSRRFDGDRASVREGAVAFALEGLTRIASVR
jgi:nicotinamide-nucleotide amidase